MYLIQAQAQAQIDIIRLQQSQFEKQRKRDERIAKLKKLNETNLAS